MATTEAQRAACCRSREKHLVERRARERELYAQNREKVLARKKATRLLNLARYLELERAKHARRRDLERVASRRRRIEQPERAKASQQRYYAAHPDRRRETKRLSESKHRDRVLEERERFRAAHPDYASKWYAEHRAELSVRGRLYRDAHPEQTREKNRRNSGIRRARQHDAFVAPVEMREVFDRCSGRCHLCGGRVKWGTAWPNPLSKSVDHLIPLARGGKHEPINVALAHLVCNMRRGPGRKPAQLLLGVA